MSRSDRLWVVSYDVSSNRRRRRIARCLEEEMTRVQFSVFEGRMSRSRLDRLVKTVSAEMCDSDSLRVYSIGAAGERHCEVRGAAIPIDKGGAYWLF